MDGLRWESGGGLLDSDLSLFGGSSASCVWSALVTLGAVASVSFGVPPGLT